MVGMGVEEGAEILCRVASQKISMPQILCFFCSIGFGHISKCRGKKKGVQCRFSLEIFLVCLFCIAKRNAMSQTVFCYENLLAFHDLKVSTI